MMDDHPLDVRDEARRTDEELRNEGLSVETLLDLISWRLEATQTDNATWMFLNLHHVT